MALQIEKRIHELTETTNKTDKFIALDSAGQAEAEKFNVNNFVDKVQTDLLYVKLSGNETINGVKTWNNNGIFNAGITVNAGDISILNGKMGINAAPDANYILNVYGGVGGAIRAHHNGIGLMLHNILEDKTCAIVGYSHDSQIKYKIGNIVNNNSLIFKNYQSGLVSLENSSGHVVYLDTTGNFNISGILNVNEIINQNGTPNQMVINPYRRIRLGRDTNNTEFRVEICKGDTTSTINHYFKGSGDSYMCGDSGNLAIGKEIAAYKLDVQGTIRAEDGLRTGTSGYNLPFKLYFIALGPWDMDTSPILSISKPADVAVEDIINVKIVIYSDDGIIREINYNPAGTTGGYFQVAPTGTIELTRNSGGPFDNASYSSLIVNRGHIQLTVKQ